MSAARPSDLHPSDTRLRELLRRTRLVLFAGLTSALGAPAHAVDGCLAMLCLAAPDWKQIPQCVPTIHQLLQDLARGKPFPRCDTGSAGTTTDHDWAQAPALCPRQYTRVVELEAGPSYTCDYSGVITVWVDGLMFTRTWWAFTGDSVTEYSTAAKAQLGNWNFRFDADLAAWLATQPPPVPANPY